jgi:hypothetical protein
MCAADPGDPAQPGDATPPLTASAIKAQTNAMIEREIARCRALHSPESWQEHGEWVTANIVASAIEWLKAQAAKGAL